MLKKLALSGAFIALLQTAAIAQQAAPGAAVPSDPPAATGSLASSPEACVKAAFALANLAEEKTLSDEEANKLEDLLTKMEAHCDARQFDEAAAVAKDIESEIATK